MRELAHWILAIALVLLVPVVPFLSFGNWLETEIESWCDPSTSGPVKVALVVSVLAADIVLPVPSSAVSTFGGAQLGAFWGTLASWLGMTVGTVAAFGLARVWGHRLAARWTDADDLARMEALCERFGPAIVVVVRPLPVLAEASVLLLGAMNLSWRRFLVPALASNLGIALVYSLLGELAIAHGHLAAALAASIAVPVLALLLARRWLPVRRVEPTGD